MEETSLNVEEIIGKLSKEQLDEFTGIVVKVSKLEKSLLNRVKELKEQVGMFNYVTTTDVGVYLGQDLFNLDKEFNPEDPFYILVDGNSRLLDKYFTHYLGKDTLEFKQMGELLGQVGLTVYDYLNADIKKLVN